MVSACHSSVSSLAVRNKPTVITTTIKAMRTKAIANMLVNILFFFIFICFLVLIVYFISPFIAPMAFLR